MNDYLLSTTEIIAQHESMDLILNITDKLCDIMKNMKDIDIQNNLIIDYFSKTLEIITDMQYEEFLQYSLNEPEGDEIRSTILLAVQHAISIINRTDNLFGLNLTDSQLNKQIEKTKYINKVMVMCLEANTPVGNYEKLVFENRVVEYIVQKGEIFLQEYNFANITFPPLTDPINFHDYYGISRTTWKFNIFRHVEKTDHLVADISSINITSLSNYKNIELLDLQNYIQIIFDINEHNRTKDKKYYCGYYNETNADFSDYQLRVSEQKTERGRINCETGHLSWYAVFSEPLTTIFTENNAQMLYDIGAFAHYRFWVSESNLIYIYIYIVFWLTFCMTVCAFIIMYIFKERKKEKDRQVHRPSEIGLVRIKSRFLFIYIIYICRSKQ